MRKIFNTSRTTGIVGLLLLSLGGVVALPTTIHGVTITPQCAALGSKKQKLATSLDQHRNIIVSQQLHTTANLPKEISSTSSTIVSLHKTADQKRKEQFKKVDIKAHTSSQKDAMKAYRSEVEAAITARRAAYAEAQNIFIADLNASLASYRSDVGIGISTMNTSFDTTINNAITLCTVKGPLEAEKTIVPGVISAQNTYLSSKAGIQTFNDHVKALKTKRQIAIKTANATSAKALEAAREKLAVAFGKDKDLVLP